jgi:MATE family multidrug resistance protein
MLGIYLQGSCIKSFIFSIMISIIWFYTEHILVLLHQSQDIARTAALYMKFLIVGCGWQQLAVYVNLTTFYLMSPRI